MYFNQFMSPYGTRSLATASSCSDPHGNPYESNQSDPNRLCLGPYSAGDDGLESDAGTRERLAYAVAPYGTPSLPGLSRSKSGTALRLLHVGPCFMNGGSEQHLIALAKFLDPQRVRFERCLVTGRKYLDPELAARCANATCCSPGASP